MNAPLVFVLASLAAVGAAFAVKAMRKPWLTPNDRVWVIGDSLGVGLLPKLKEIGQRNDIPVVGNPVGGTIIRQWSQKDLQEIETWGATTVLIVLGSNDANANEQYVRDQAPGYALDLTNKLKKMGVKIWWLAPGQTGALVRSEEVRSMIEQLAFSESFIAKPVPDFIPYWSADMIHPTPDGYRQLAEWIWAEWNRS